MSVVAVVPAAGKGERLGSPQPKAFVLLCGQPILLRAVNGLVASGRVDQVVVAAPADQVERTRELVAPLRPVPIVVAGGANRTASVSAALDAALDSEVDAEVILVHDAARALTPRAVINAVVDAVLAGHPAVIPVLPVADTIKSVDDSGWVRQTVERSGLRAVQTPQGFRPDLLRRAYRGTSATDDAGMVERLGEPVWTVLGDPLAFKITTPFDLRLAEAVLRIAEPR